MPKKNNKRIWYGRARHHIQHYGAFLLVTGAVLSFYGCGGDKGGDDPVPPTSTPPVTGTTPDTPDAEKPVDEPTPAPDDVVPNRSAFASVSLLSPEATLRKATLSLAGRLPSAKETQYVMNNIDNLDPVLDEVLKEDAFYTRLTEIYNDFLLTDKYLGNENAINLIKDDNGARAGDGFDAGGAFNNRRWYQTLYDASEMSDADKATLSSNRNYTNTAMAREILNLLTYIVKHDLPYSQILTADYTVLNAYAAKSLNALPIEPWTDATDPNELRPVRINGYPHAGLLTSPMFLNRFPTTFTNRNRHRARIVYDLFLDIDILALDGDRPNMADDIASENAVVTNPNCAVCHDIVDPVASLFQNFTDDGRYVVPERGWFQDMQPRGFSNGDPFDLSYTYNSLQWLGQEIAKHSNFAPATVRIIYKGLTGEDTLKLQGGESEDYKAEYQRQKETLTIIADAFKADNYNLKTAIKSFIKSPLYRARSVEEADIVTHQSTGAIRLLTPEMLDRKIDAIFDMQWKNYSRYDSRYDKGMNLEKDKQPRLTDTRAFLQLYGGIDSDQITTRINEPNGIMTSVQERMANEMACFAVPLDFFREVNNEKSKSRLFPYVSMNDLPLDIDNKANVASINSIKQNIQHLHQLILGESLSLTDPELLATYNLFLQVWLQGNALISSDTTSKSLPGRCQVHHHPDFPTMHNPEKENELLALNNELKVVNDHRYVIRAWMAIVSYLTSDYRFVYE